MALYDSYRSTSYSRVKDILSCALGVRETSWLHAGLAPPSPGRGADPARPTGGAWRKPSRRPWHNSLSTRLSVYQLLQNPRGEFLAGSCPPRRLQPLSVDLDARNTVHATPHGRKVSHPHSARRCPVRFLERPGKSASLDVHYDWEEKWSPLIYNMSES